MSDLNIYDYIIVGAWSAGSVVASRLSENGKYSVLLLEAGGQDRYTIRHRLKDGLGLELFFDWAKVPIGMYKLWMNPDYVWQFSTMPDEYMAGQKHYWPRGKIRPFNQVARWCDHWYRHWTFRHAGSPSDGRWNPP